jgi:hypothetical protein
MMKEHSIDPAISNLLSVTHVPVRPEGSKQRRAGGLFSVGCLTRQDDLALLSITVIADMISAANARRCFRSLTDAYIRPAPDRR